MVRDCGLGGASVHVRLSWSSNSAPFVHKAPFAEEIRLHRQEVKPTIFHSHAHVVGFKELP